MLNDLEKRDWYARGMDRKSPSCCWSVLASLAASWAALACGCDESTGASPGDPLPVDASVDQTTPAGGEGGGAGTGGQGGSGGDGGSIDIDCSHGTVYYVSLTAGDDAHDGLSPSAAWQTLGKANATLSPGDRVEVMAGTYAESIRPAVSGAPDQCITYASHGGDEVTISNVTVGADLTNRSYVVLDGLRFQQTSSQWVLLDAGTNNIIANARFHDAGSWGGIVFRNGSDHNIVLDCEFPDAPKEDDHSNPSDLIQLWGGHHNLIQGSRFGRCAHSPINMQHRTGDPWMTGSRWNVVRHNRFDNPWHRSGVESYNQADRNLVEHNTFLNAGTDNTDNPTPGSSDPSDWHHNAVQIGASGVIVRHSVFIHNRLGITITAYGETTSDHVRAYHNSFYRGYNHWRSEGHTVFDDAVFKNNIFFDTDPAAGSNQYEVFVTLGDLTRTHTVAHNDIARSGDEERIRYKELTGRLSAIEQQYPAEWYGNLNADPLYVDADAGDLTLQAGSPMVDAGTHLTVATEAGTNSSTLVVEDAGYFFSGPGDPWRVPGTVADRIVIEGAEPVAIESIDYAAQTLMLSEPRSWPAGAKIYHRPFHGAAPDVGAFER